MTSNNIIAAKEEVAHHLNSTWLSDLPTALPPCFRASRDGLFIVEGSVPTIQDFEAGVSTMSALVEVAKKMKGSFNLMLGDALRLAAQFFGPEEAERLKGEYIQHNGRVEHTVDEIQRVCESFPAPEDRDGLDFTHLQLLLPQKKKLSEEEFGELVEWARDGEATVLNDEVVAKKPKPCSQLRTRIQELSGKAANVSPVLRDPTHDAERLKLAEGVCRSLLEIRDGLPARWAILPRSVVESFVEWELHVEPKKAVPSSDARKRVLKFFIQPTRSFPEHAPQREEYEDDDSFFDACEVYDREWLETYICEDSGCKNSDCPQHHPSSNAEWREALNSQKAFQ
jgi:hypothetical protein